ncbi:MAG TPA: hypothetical protein PLS69_04870, partial [Terricaulis sp.]|nr:hypothetical protein [Terricaulis sp.]
VRLAEIRRERDLVAGAGAEQDVKEALLAYSVLRRAERALTQAEIDAAAELYLRERFDLAVNFEIHDALDKLKRLGLVAQQGEKFEAVPPHDALVRLDAAWDGLFHFSARA